MTYALINTPPAISFGFGQIEKQALVNENITVWLGTLYRQDAYTFMLTAPGATITQISDYEYTLAYLAPGTYQVTLTVNSTSKSISLQSNILMIDII